MNNEIPSRSHYPGLDGLRGIAILLVILYHNFGFIPFLNYGWLGVDLFFVLSGFLITEILLHTRDTANYYRNFYTRRVLRIFPLYYLCLILVIIIFPLIKNFPYDLTYFKENQAWFWFYLQNWMLILKDWNDNAILLNHFWSLAVEEQFYIVWPFLVLLIKKPRQLLIITFVLLLSVILARFFIWVNRADFPSYGNLFLFTRVDGILIGAMLALVKNINYNFLKKYSFVVTLSLALLNFLFYFINGIKNYTFPYWAIVGYSTFAVIFAMLVFETIDRENRLINFILNNPLLRFTGKISYGFYVFHWPVYILLYDYFEKWVRQAISFPEKGILIVIATFLTLIALLISIVSYYGFERYFLKMKKSFS
jgi:peptidoglycan/LPS O-acetylase OafA/YrhL